MCVCMFFLLAGIAGVRLSCGCSGMASQVGQEDSRSILWQDGSYSDDVSIDNTRP